MAEWWSGLTALNQALFCVAFFFSALFLWQLIAAIVGLAGGGADAEVGAGGADFHADVGAGAHFGSDVPHDMPHDVTHDFAGTHPGEHLGVEGAETLVSFRLLSVRGIIAFGTLFGWAGALYLQEGTPTGTSILYALVWAFIGMLVVSGIFYLMQRMTESGTPRLATCVGEPGTVYMDIPAGGEGKIRTLVGGVVSFIGARTAQGEALAGGTPVVVTRLLDSSTVEVRRATSEGGPTDA